jgi:polyprenyl synthetase
MKNLSTEQYREEFLHYLKQSLTAKQPTNLYEPIAYILNLGGKRLRPVLTMMAADLFGADYHEALPAATAVEMFHNFSLVHDDIMDKAPLRRGCPTVHHKWNVNTAILSGDAMLILTYQLLEHYPPAVFGRLTQLLSRTALEVCEGQQYDMDFEVRSTVTTEEYLLMIRYKTAVLIGAALQMGAIVAATSPDNQQHIYNFGLQLGLAFQLQDDYLDAFGDDTFGKQIGGDILENKKTMLYLKALELSDAAQRTALLQHYATTDQSPEKVAAVKQLFQQTGADTAVRKAITHYTDEALASLDSLAIDEEKRTQLRTFAIDLMDRKI